MSESTEKINQQVGTLFEKNVIQIKKVDVLRMVIRGKPMDMFFFQFEGAMKNQHIFDTIKNSKNH